MANGFNTYNKSVSSNQALLWLEFEGAYIDGSGNKVIKNYGTLGPATVKCGDGTTASTFPTQLSSGKGFSFDGGDYIDTGIVDAFERTDKFTLFVAYKAAYSTVNADLISTIDSAQSYRGFGINISDPNKTIDTYIINTYDTNCIAATGSVIRNAIAATTAAMTYNGLSLFSGINVYIDGKNNSQISYKNNLSLTIKSNKNIILGARHNGTAKISQFTGNIYFAAIFPFQLSDQQIASLDHYVRTRINNAGAKPVSPDSALLWLEFENQYTDSNNKRVIKNYGRAAGSPATVQCGNGSTTTTFPTQLAGRKGLYFDGGDYIDTGIIDPFERTDKFSLFVVASTTADQSLLMYMATDDAAASPVRGIQYYTYLGNRIYLDMFSTPATNSVSIYGTGGVTTRSINSACVTYNGGSNAASVLGYFNGIITTKTVVADTLSATIKNGKSLLIGARYNGAAKAQPYVGNMHFAAIFPYQLTPNEVAVLDRYVRARINQS